MRTDSRFRIADLRLPGCVLLGVLLLASVVSAEQGARYLIISADDFTDAAQPLAEWKTKKGMLTKVVPISDIGNNAGQIQTYIRDAYSSWPIPPEYVLILGGGGLITSHSSYDDSYYGDMEGDYKMEIPVGRLPANTVRECSTVVAKVLGYEKPPLEGDTAWFLKGTTVIHEDNGPDDTLYWGDSRLMHGYWLDHGYTLAESLSTTLGHNSADVTASANDGRAFITYRGQGVGSWWGFGSINPFAWTNGNMMPIVVGATCTTMGMSGGEEMYGNKFVRAGTPDGLGGAIAYFGTTGVITHGAHFRSAGYRGFADAIFVEKELRLGEATLRARFRVDSLYHHQARYLEWNLFGDPEMNIWTGVPRECDVNYDSVIVMAPQDLVVTVTVNGRAFHGALVCVSMDSVVYVWGETDGTGRVELPVNPTHIGTMDVVVTGRNLQPFEGTCAVHAGGIPYVVIGGTSIDDYVGNHDGIVNPGERFRLRVDLKNLGEVTATGVSAILRTSEPGVTVHDSTASYGTILPDSTVSGDPFDLEFGSGFEEGDVVPTTLQIWDSEGDTWNRSLNLTVRAGRLEFVSVALLDSPPGGNANGLLGRSESGRMQIAIANTGGGSLDDVEAVLVTSDTTVAIVDSTGFYGQSHAGDTLAGDFDRFGITAGPNLVPGQPVSLMLVLTGSGGTYTYADSFQLELATEEGTVHEPTGPDAYGYWCYDDTDSASGRAPTYDWLDLSSGVGTVIDSVSDKDAATVTVPLPFGFKYYGQNYSFLSICSNGFLALGYTSYRFGSNRPLPDTGGPTAMVAPFWDDLNPDEGSGGYGTAYEYYDEANHRYMIEFKEFAHYGQQSIRETFQAVFYDPAFHTTPTGDGEIVFFYNRVSLNSGCTIGIEDHTETRAIEYLYNNSYPPTAAYLQSERAIRFTTLGPENQSNAWLVLHQVTASDSAGGNNNGLFEAGETLTVEVTIENRGSADARNTDMLLRSLEVDAVVMDSLAALGDIAPGGQATNTAQPFVFRIAPTPEDSILNFELQLTADGYVTTAYFSIGLSDVTGMAEQGQGGLTCTSLERVQPNPARSTAVIRYGLARPGHVDLALFDVTGRRVRTLVRGQQGQGRYAVSLGSGTMSQGTYFCRLTVTADGQTQRFAEKLLLVE